VCKIVNYGKYKYEIEKKKKEAGKAQKASKLKELKFRIGIDPHDYLIKISHAEEFLSHGDKVRMQLQFRGRQMAHQELGFQLANKIKEDLQTTGHIEFEPKMAGRNINLQFTPLPEKQRVRKFANFKHGRFIDPEEEDNEHEVDEEHGHDEKAQKDGRNNNHDGNHAPAAKQAAQPAPAPAAAPAPVETAV
jgi:translation initiation factor IF-3